LFVCLMAQQTWKTSLCNEFIA